MKKYSEKIHIALTVLALVLGIFYAFDTSKATRLYLFLGSITVQFVYPIYWSRK